jgi:uncharacterized protein
MMLAKGVSINAVSVINDYSVKFPEEIYHFFKSIGLKHMQFIPCVELDHIHQGKTASFSVDSKQYGRFLCTLFDLWYSDIQGEVASTFIRFFDAVLFTYMGLKPPECTLSERCGEYLVVEHNGDVFPCDFFVGPKWRIGNIKETPLPQMMNSHALKEFGQQKSRLTSTCKTCIWVKYCKGGCIKDRFNNPQDKNHNYFCEAYKIFYQHSDRRLSQLAEKIIFKLQTNKGVDNIPSCPQKARKIARNDACSCGSGKKFKKCCMPNRGGPI